MTRLEEHGGETGGNESSHASIGPVGSGSDNRRSLGVGWWVDGRIDRRSLSVGRRVDGRRIDRRRVDRGRVDRRRVDRRSLSVGWGIDRRRVDRRGIHRRRVDGRWVDRRRLDMRRRRGRKRLGDGARAVSDGEGGGSSDGVSLGTNADGSGLLLFPISLVNALIRCFGVSKVFYSLLEQFYFRPGGKLYLPGSTW